MNYYTPSIEDFHVGFEYEENGFGQPRAFTEESSAWDMAWNKCIIEEDFATPPIINGIENKTIRVKYLDHEDIVAEGWENCGKQINESYGFSKDSYWLELYEDGDVIISSSEPTDDEDYVTYFNGTIRNKSELKLLMKMLNITAKSVSPTPTKEV